MLSTFHYYYFHSFGTAIPTINTWAGIIFVLSMFVVVAIGIKLSHGELKKNMLFFALVMVIPPFLGMAINLFIMKVYHHRFFIFAFWAIYILLAWSLVNIANRRRVYGVLLFAVMFVMAINLVTYWTTFDVELAEGSKVFRDSGCHSGLPVVHETMFSMMSSKYYNEIYGCNVKDYVWADWPQKALNSGGFDSIDVSERFANEDVSQFPEFYYFANKKNLGNGTTYCELLYEKGGLFVEHCFQKNIFVRSENAEKEYSDNKD
jgi:hypothetical protein